jgi:2-keto-4-pentenoate hydratase/2-oxohepta-3-ene-1,7-dioic acid hydratase in catechol pathway
VAFVNALAGRRADRLGASMRFCRLALDQGSVVPVVHARLVDDGHAQPLDAAPWEGGRDAGAPVAFAHDQLRAPCRPSKIVCIGRNYAAHAKELGNEVPSEPLLFLKPPSAIVGPGEAIVRPRASERVEHEAEVGVVIGRRAKDVAIADAMDFVFGFTALCDVTARDLQKKDVQFTRGKGFDTFCPIGPWIETSIDWRDCGVALRVGGTVRQSGRTRDMIFPIDRLVAYVSAVMTLEPGDVIATGTPEGVGPLRAGDVVEVDIEGVGVLRNPVVDAR